MKQVKGIITIFMTFVLVFLLSLMLVLLESARIEGLKVVQEQAGNAAIESVLAEFLAPLFQKYGIMALDTGYGKNYVDEESILDDFSYYYENNLSSFSSLQVGNMFSVKGVIYEIEDLNLLIDNGANAYIQSIMKYYPIETAGDILQRIRQNLVQINQGEEIKENQLGSTKNAPANEVQIIFCQTTGDQEESEEENAEELYDEIKKDSPIEKAEEIEKKGWLSIVLPEGSPLSGYSFETSEFPSTNYQEEVTFADKTETSLLKKVVFNEYVLHHLNSYTNHLNDSGVQYEVEYLLVGKNSDDQNLKKTLEKIAWMREALNLLYLFSDRVKVQEAYLMAFDLASWTGNPVIIEMTKLGLLASWAYAETLLDVRSLVQGKTVPILKTKKSWTLNLSEIATFLNGKTFTAKETKGGLNYQDYLRILLFLADSSDIVYQSMDMIQERLGLQCTGYRFENSAYGLSIRADGLSAPLFSGLTLIQNQYGKKASAYLIENVFRKEY